MAKKTGVVSAIKHVKKKTSIGKSHRSRPTNKHKKKGWKKYKGQGK